MPNLRRESDRDTMYILLPAIILMCGVLFGALFLFVGFDSLTFSIERPYLIPWVIATGIAVMIPLVYLLYRKEFSLVHPLVFAAITNFLPLYFIGGWSLTFGLSNYFYLNYVTDPEYNFPLTFVYIIVGFLGMSLGFFIPFGKKIGNYIANWLPVWEFNAREVVMPSVIFFGFGLFASFIAFTLGQIGYQSDDRIIGVTGSLSYYLTLVLPATTFLLWIAFFRFEKWNKYHVIIGVIQLLIAVFMLILLGGRSSLVVSLLAMVFSFVLAGRKLQLKHWLLLGVIMPVTLVVGFVYGTTFRTLKANADRTSVGDYVSIALETVTLSSENDWSKQAQESFDVLAERLEIVSSLAVVVSNYEQLQPYEADYGLENNIWTYTWTGFIPRFLWTDKPIVSDNSSYNELYFDHAGFGLAITPMGDLLRNYGPLGVPIGMILLGFGLRIFYAMFIEGLPFSYWRSTVYLSVLVKISYDGFYGEIFPTMLRVGAVIFFQMFILKVVIFSLRRKRGF